MSLPYFPMFPADFEAKTSHLSLAEDGAYNRLLRICWMSPGCTIPNDEAWIFRRCRAHSEPEREAVRAVLAEFFTATAGRLSNARLLKEWNAANEAYSKRANAGSKGGKAKALKGNGKAPSNAKAMLKQPEPEPDTIPIAKAIGADAPRETGFHDAIWTRGVRFLTERGVTEKQARAFLGKAKKQHGDEAVFNALSAAAKAGAVDPIPYITKALQSVAHPEAQKLEAWGIPDAQPVRPLPRIADIDTKKPPGTPDLPGVQREQKEEEREMFISNDDARGHSDILPPLRAQCGSKA